MEARGVSDYRFKKACPCPNLWVSHPVVQNGAERIHPTVKAGQMGLNMGFLKGPKTELLGTKIIGLFDIRAVCGILLNNTEKLCRIFMVNIHWPKLQRKLE